MEQQNVLSNLELMFVYLELPALHILEQMLLLVRQWLIQLVNHVKMEMGQIVQFPLFALLMSEQVPLFVRQLSIQVVKYVNGHLGLIVELVYVLIKRMLLVRMIVLPKWMLHVNMSELELV
jgi:hypothetical protein